MENQPQTLDEAIAFIEQYLLAWSIGKYPTQHRKLPLKHLYWATVRWRYRIFQGEGDTPLAALLAAYAEYDAAVIAKVKINEHR